MDASDGDEDSSGSSMHGHDGQLDADILNRILRQLQEMEEKLAEVKKENAELKQEKKKQLSDRRKSQWISPVPQREEEDPDGFKKWAAEFDNRQPQHWEKRLFRQPAATTAALSGAKEATLEQVSIPRFEDQVSAKALTDFEQRFQEYLNECSARGLKAQPLRVAVPPSQFTHLAKLMQLWSRDATIPETERPIWRTVKPAFFNHRLDNLMRALVGLAAAQQPGRVLRDVGTHIIETEAKAVLGRTPEVEANRSTEQRVGDRTHFVAHLEAFAMRVHARFTDENIEPEDFETEFQILATEQRKKYNSRMLNAIQPAVFRRAVEVISLTHLGPDFLETQTPLHIVDTVLDHAEPLRFLAAVYEPGEEGPAVRGGRNQEPNETTAKEDGHKLESKAEKRTTTPQRPEEDSDKSSQRKQPPLQSPTFPPASTPGDIYISSTTQSRDDDDNTKATVTGEQDEPEHHDDDGAADSEEEPASRPAQADRDVQQRARAMPVSQHRRIWDPGSQQDRTS